MEPASYRVGYYLETYELDRRNTKTPDGVIEKGQTSR